MKLRAKRLSFIFLFSLISLLFLIKPAYSWWNADYQYKRQYDFYNPTTTSSWFPIIVNVTSLTDFNDDLSDFRSIDSLDTSEHKYNFEFKDSSGNYALFRFKPNSTGIPASSNYTSYIYYGYSSATNNSQPQNVWNVTAHYTLDDQIVMDDTLVNNLTVTGTPEYKTDRSCPYGNCYGFFGSTVNILSTTLAVPSSETVCAWVNRTVMTESYAIWQTGGTYFGIGDPYSAPNNGGLACNLLGNGHWIKGEMTANKWYYICCVWNSTHVALYSNGTRKSTWDSYAVIAGPQTLYIGRGSSGVTYAWSGEIDEVLVINGSMNTSSDNDNQMMALYQTYNQSNYVLGAGPSFNFTSTVLYLNGTAGDYVTTFGSAVNITTTFNASGTFYVVKNGTAIGSGNSPLKFVLNQSDMANATYNITAYWNGNTTHRKSSSTHYILVSKANGTTPTLTASPGWSISEKTISTITCSGTGSPVLYKDNIIITSPYISIPASGIYNFTCALPSTGNYTIISVANFLNVIPSGFGCTNTSVYAFQISITSSTMNTMLNLSYLINSTLIKSDLSDVWVNTTAYPTSKNSTLKFLIVNNSNNDFIVQFGNYIANNSYPDWNGTLGNMTNITSGYTQLSNYYNLLFFDEETGISQTPPSSVKSLTLYCPVGVSSISLDNSSTSIIVATVTQLDSIRATVTYSPTSSYYRDYLVSSPVDSKYIFLVDAFSKQVLQMLFKLDDRTGTYGVGDTFRVQKYLGSTLRTITELPFDIELKAIAFLVSGDTYQISVDNGIEERTIGNIYTDPSSLTKNIVIQGINVFNTTISNFTFNLTFTNGIFNFYWFDPSGLTNSVEFWVYNYTNTTSYVQQYYTSSSNHSLVNFVYTVPDVNQSYMTKFAIHHAYYGNNTFGWSDFWNAANYLRPVINPFMTILTELGGNTWWFLMLFVAPLSLLMPTRYIGITAILMVCIVGLLSFWQWYVVSIPFLLVCLLLAILIEASQRKRWKEGS